MAGVPRRLTESEERYAAIPVHRSSVLVPDRWVGSVREPDASQVIWPAARAALGPTAALQADSAFKLGPHSTNLLSTLTLMDADSDGSVTLDEMLGYFAAVGGALTDDEFGTVVSEMTDQANASKMEHMAGAMLSARTHE